MAYAERKVRWWDWLLSPPPMIALLLLMDELVPYLVSDPYLERWILRYARYGVYLITVLWCLSWWRRFGWKTPLPERLTAFWVAAMLVALVVYVAIFELLRFFHGP
jgi:hypothetical protein